MKRMQPIHTKQNIEKFPRAILQFAVEFISLIALAFQMLAADGIPGERACISCRYILYNTQLVQNSGQQTIRDFL